MMVRVSAKAGRISEDQPCTEEVGGACYRTPNKQPSDELTLS